MEEVCRWNVSSTGRGYDVAMCDALSTAFKTSNDELFCVNSITLVVPMKIDTDSYDEQPTMNCGVD